MDVERGWLPLPAAEVIAAKVPILELDNTNKLKFFKPDEAY